MAAIRRPSGQKPCRWRLAAPVLLPDAPPSEQGRQAGQLVCLGPIRVTSMPTTKPECWPRAFVCSAVVLSQGIGPPRGCGRNCARFLLGNRLIVCRSAGIQLWAELPALAPGARCRLGRSVGSGAPEAGPLAVQWTATGLFQQNSYTPGTPEIRRECWSRGRIVSALLAGAQGGCLPSVEPPNPVAITMAPPAGGSNACSRFDIARYRRQRVFMKGASPRRRREDSSGLRHDNAAVPTGGGSSRCTSLMTRPDHARGASLHQRVRLATHRQAVAGRRAAPSGCGSAIA
jgi:hypothetical protein